MADQVFSMDISPMYQSSNPNYGGIRTGFASYQADQFASYQANQFAPYQADQFAPCQAGPWIYAPPVETTTTAAGHIWTASYPHNGNMLDTTTHQASSNSIMGERGHDSASSWNQPYVFQQVQEPAVVESLPEKSNDGQEPVNWLDNGVSVLSGADRKAYREARKAKKQFSRPRPTLATEQKGSGMSADLDKLTKQNAHLHAELREVRTRSKEETRQLRRKISESVRGRANVRNTFVGIVRRQNKDAIDAVHRLAMLQDEVIGLKEQLATWMKLANVSERERNRLLNAHNNLLEARNRDTELRFKKIRNMAKEKDDEWEASQIEGEPKDVLEGEVSSTC